MELSILIITIILRSIKYQQINKGINYMKLSISNIAWTKEHDNEIYTYLKEKQIQGLEMLQPEYFRSYHMIISKKQIVFLKISISNMD